MRCFISTGLIGHKPHHIRSAAAAAAAAAAEEQLPVAESRLWQLTEGPVQLAVAVAAVVRTAAAAADVLATAASAAVKGTQSMRSRRCDRSEIELPRVERTNVLTRKNKTDAGGKEPDVVTCQPKRCKEQGFERLISLRAIM